MAQPSDGGDLWAELHEYRKRTIAGLEALRRRVQEGSRRGAAGELGGALEILEMDANYKYRQLLMVAFFENAYAYHGMCTNVRARRHVEALRREDKQLRVQQAMLGGVFEEQDTSGDGSDDGEGSDESIRRVEQHLCAEAQAEAARPLESLRQLSSAKRVAPCEPLGSFKVRVVEAHARVNRSRPVARRGVPRTYPEPGEELAPTIDYRRAQSEREPGATLKVVNRSTLLEQVNAFLVSAGVPTVDKRDAIWSGWFLSEYLGLGKEELESGKPLLVEELPARDSPDRLLEHVRKAIRAGELESAATRRARISLSGSLDGASALGGWAASAPAKGVAL
jgi:hypothetical protein